LFKIVPKIYLFHVHDDKNHPELIKFQITTKFLNPGGIKRLA